MKLSDIIHYDVKQCMAFFGFKSNCPGDPAGVCPFAFTCTAISSYIYEGISMLLLDIVYYGVK